MKISSLIILSAMAAATTAESAHAEILAIITLTQLNLECYNDQA
jgi:hypothetical protein